MTRIRPTIRQNAQAFMMGLPEGREAPAWVGKALGRKVSARPRRLEDAFQIACCQYLDLLPATLYWATPASTWVGDMTGAKLGYLAKQKRMGVKKGVPDLSILFRNKHGATVFCFAELKVEARVSDEQKNFLDSANQLGAFTGVCHSLEEFQALLLAAGHPRVYSHGSLGCR